MLGPLHLVNDPLPMAGGFDGDLAVRWERLEKGVEGGAIRFDADRLGPFAACVDGYEDGIPFVNIASDNVSHGKLLLKSWRSIAANVPQPRFHTITP